MSRRNFLNNRERKFPNSTSKGKSQNHVESSVQNLKPAKRNNPIAFSTIEKLCKDLDTKKMLVGSMDLLIAVQADSFYLRLDSIWPEADKQLKLIRVINATASATQSSILELTHKFLSKILKANFIDTLINSHIKVIKLDSTKWTDVHAQIVDNFVTLMLICFERLPTQSDMYLEKMELVMAILTSLDFEFLLASTKLELEKLKLVINHRYAIKRDQLTNELAQKGPIKPKREFEGDSGPPPDNFRNISIIPNSDEIIDGKNVFLRPAKNIGEYESDEHYLDIQFRLLREDAIRPLRDGIIDYKKGGKTDLYIYRDVELVRTQMYKQTGDLVTYAKIHVYSNMKWNKRLKYGSLVCLSTDNFKQHLVFAIVLDRDIDLLGKGLIGLKFENTADAQTTFRYSMVESPAFFEAYRHVLLAMQSLRADEPIPFSNYLVFVQKTTDIPIYVYEHMDDYDFLCLLKNEEARNDPLCSLENLLEKYKPEDFGMDKSQLEALHYALSSRMAIIQGPPGTGKTFLGLQLTMLLFSNEIKWYYLLDKRPLLIVCYTNHALDQFLEGIATFLPEGIVRVGGRCKNPALEKFSLSNMRQRSNDSTLGRAFFNARQESEDLQKEIQEMTDDLEDLNKHIAGLFILNKYLSGNRSYHSLAAFNSDSEFADWLRGNVFLAMDVQEIRNLVDWGYDEQFAKAAQCVCYYRYNRTDSMFVSDFICRVNPNSEMQRALQHVKGWPQIADIDKLSSMGVSEALAIQMLIASGGNTKKVFDDQNRLNRAIRTSNTSQKAQMDESEIDELLFKDFDEENRVVIDGFGFNHQREKRKKRKKENKAFFKLQHMKHYILNSRSMSRVQAEEVTKSIKRMPLHDRWRLYKLWVVEAENAIQNKMHAICEEYGNAIKALTGLRSCFDLNVLRQARVIGMTTTGAAMHQATLRTLQPRIVIVEEAAEILEGHLLTSLTSGCEHLILIGDHKQLRPNPSVYELAKKYNLEISLFERLINNGYPFKMLENQHRMRPEISRNLMPMFYPDLKDDDSVNNFPDVLGMSRNLFFFNHDHSEVSDPEFKSHRNPFEAGIAVRIAQYLIQQNYKANEVTILCTYLEQLLELRKIATQRFGKNHEIRIDNVDNYQGEECKIIILSLVRSNNPENKIGFLDIPNRVCVALSRAKIGLYVIANMDFLAENSKNLWKDIKENVAEIGAIGEKLPIKCQLHGKEQFIESVEDFDVKSPEGGCMQPCNFRLECGHSCLKPCHSVDLEHQNQKCLKQCTKTCNNGHPCEKPCFEDCGNCLVKIEKTLPCGHKKNDFCFLPIDKVVCAQMCQKSLACGHLCQNRCNQACSVSCDAMVEKTLKCAHIKKMKCSSNIESVECEVKVEKRWPICDHSVQTTCSTDIHRIPCPKECQMELPECGHLCKGTCGGCRNGRIHILCSEKCNRILLCGHECKSKCSKICPPCVEMCETACGHSQCSLQAVNGRMMQKVRSKGQKNSKGKPKSRVCGDACPRCAEQCLNGCEHRQCTKKCWMPCDVEPCMEPCQKLLSCSPKPLGKGREGPLERPHLCLGVCGEECLKICRICKPEEFAEISELFFGTEDDENARFIRLEDCGHYFEMSGIDKWVNDKVTNEKNDGGSVAVVNIECPKCKTPIRRSKRYIALLNQRAMDIESIKYKMHGGQKQNLSKEWKKICDENIVFSENTLIVENSLVATYIENFKKILYSLKNIEDSFLTKNWFNIGRNIIRIVNRLWVLSGKIRNEKFNKQALMGVRIASFSNINSALLKYQINSDLNGFLFEEIYSISQRFIDKEKADFVKQISELMLQQILYEINRLEFIFNLFQWISRSPMDMDLKSTELFNEILKNLFSEKEFVGEHEVKLKNLFDELMKLHIISGFAFSEEERMEIIKAVGMDVRKWYKCSKGHLYGIGDCGQAMVESKCPECKETIGGMGHRLTPTSMPAPEMHVGIIEPAEFDPFEARYF